MSGFGLFVDILINTYVNLKPCDIDICYGRKQIPFLGTLLK